MSEPVLNLVDESSDEESGKRGFSDIANDPSAKRQKVEPGAGDLAKNEDFISFDFSESEGENKADDSGDSDDDSDNDNGTSVNSKYPWILNRDHSKQKEVADWLTNEIIDFVSYISPSKDEIKRRNQCVLRLKTAIESFWKDCKVYVFGSYATDLYLPNSDIDMVVMTDANSPLSKNSGYVDLKDTRSSIYKLSSFLKKSNIVQSIQVLANTRVPIIKLVEEQTGLNVDISFERSNGLETALVIEDWLTNTPGLRELVLCVKSFLYGRGLNEVHFGGLGGFSTICLVYVFLKLHPRLATNNMDAQRNLGVLLIEFFELFGKNFGYEEVAIVPRSAQNGQLPAFVPKSHCPALKARSQFSLMIQDPSDPLNNISSGSFNMKGWLRAFGAAFDILVEKCYELDKKSFSERLDESILGTIIKYKGEKRTFRDDRALVKNIALISNQKLHFKESEESNFFDEKSDSESDSEPAPESVSASDYESESESESGSGSGADSDSDNNDSENADGPEVVYPSYDKKIEDKDEQSSSEQQKTQRLAKPPSVEKLLGLSDENPEKPVKPMDPEAAEEKSKQKENKRLFWSMKGSGVI